MNERDTKAGTIADIETLRSLIDFRFIELDTKLSKLATNSVLILSERKILETIGEKLLTEKAMHRRFLFLTGAFFAGAIITALIHRIIA